LVECEQEPILLAGRRSAGSGSNSLSTNGAMRAWQQHFQGCRFDNRSTVVQLLNSEHVWFRRGF
jgi:hypothetical protein